MKHLLLSVTLFSSFSFAALSAHAEETQILKPSYLCQSQEFAIDDSVHAVVIQDPVSGDTHVDVARTWLGGVRKSTYQVKELVGTGIPGAPKVFEGEGLRLSIESTLNANEQYLAATLSTSTGERDSTQDDKLICLPASANGNIYYF